LINAADALDSGKGEIRASTCVSRSGATISNGLSLNDVDEYALVKISDNGCGITDDAKPKLFDPFFTTKGDGRGIGLAAVSGIVKAHRGDIGFTSEVGTGTTFAVAFPLTREQHENPASEAQAPERASNLRVLAVDDDELVLATTRLLLESASFDVSTANSGQTAVDLISRSDEDAFDIVLLDQTMPGLSGLETCEVLRNHGVDIPFILMSGFCKIGDIGQSEQVTYMSKPFSRQQLLDAISEAVGHSLALQVDASV
jgi:two-component system cell cycle sensor histidine kinase/response regulator CckA